MLNENRHFVVETSKLISQSFKKFQNQENMFRGQQEAGVNEIQTSLH